MKLHAGLLVPPRELSSRMQVRVSICLLLQMTSHLCLLILSGLAASSQLGLEDVFFSPQDQTVREGEGVFFRCVSGESSPLASITWLKDGKVVTRGRQIQGDFGGGHQKKTSGTLHLFNVTLEDDGVYVCVTHNPSLNISKSSKRAKLTVQGVPRRLQFVQGPDNITVAIGTEVSMHCSVLGFPVPMVHWFKDGCLLMNCSASFSLQDNGQLLTFRNVSKEDKGSYHCEASNQKETIRSQPASLLPAEMDWSFVQQPTNLTVKSGKNVTVTCRPPYSRPAAQVSWFKNSQLLSPAGHVTMLPSGDLFFHSVQEYDSGSYFCRASNTHLQRFLTSRRATLTVLAPPSVKLWPQVLTVSLGARVVLECQVSGHPLPSISWMKRGHSKQTGGKISLGQRNATLHIQSVRSYDEGVYVCEATNTLGQSHSTALLRVAVSPVIVGFKSQVSCTIGTSVVLTCRAAGILPITYTWTRGRAETQVPISPTEGRHIDEHGALHISSVQYSDVGEYYCIAENRAGRHQKRMILTITAEDQPADRGKQTRLVLSVSTSDSKQHPVSKSSDSIAEQHLTTTHHPHVQEKHNETACTSPDSPTTFPTFSRKARAELNMPSRLLARVLHHQLKQPTISPTQSLLTQMQPPILLPPPHLNFQLEDLHTSGVPVTSKPPFIAHSEPAATQSLAPEAETLQSPLNESRSHLRQMSSKFQHSASDKLFAVSSSSDSATHAVLRVSPITEMSVSQQPSKLRVSGPSGILKENSYMTTPTPNPVTQMKVRSSDSVTLTVTSETSFQPLQPSPARSQTTQTHLQHSVTLSFRPKFHLELSTVQYNLPSTELPSSSVTKPQTSVYLSTTTSATSTLSQTQTEFRATQHPQLSLSTIHPRDQAFHPSVLDPEVVQQVNRSYWLNTTQKSTPVQPELTNWLRRNTSQSPMTSNDPRVKQQSPSWLPMLEKHDIPIVVGVGVSLAFIFITVTFYSVVQKNEPAPTSRAAQRNLGVPIRHAERRAAGRTYENRAFEDDDCVAVIEQSPNTSDTRARPPGPSLVTVQVEPMFESLQEDTQPSLDNHSVTVEMYPEPILDTKIDPSLEEEKGCSLSQPSIQLHCAEDCTSNRGDNQSPWRQDTLPPPSPLISRSPSPSPPSRREEGVHSSLTLQSAEPCVAPIHHSLSISHGNPPLLLSHNVSVGLTTVAVDVHFYPAATASMAVGTSTHINSVSNSSSVTAPLFSPTLANSQENDQSASRLHHCK